MTSPFTQKAIRSASPCEDYSARQKHAKYDKSFQGKPYTFSALVFETTGAINDEGARVIAQVARFAAKCLGRAPSAVGLGSASPATSRGQFLRLSSTVSTAP